MVTSKEGASRLVLVAPMLRASRLGSFASVQRASSRFGRVCAACESFWLGRIFESAWFGLIIACESPLFRPLSRLDFDASMRRVSRLCLVASVRRVSRFCLVASVRRASRLCLVGSM